MSDQVFPNKVLKVTEGLALVTADLLHQAVIDGRLFTISLVETLSGPGVFKYRIKTGDNHVHVLLFFAASSKVTSDVYEDVVVDSQGTAVPINAYNRMIGGAPLSTAFKGAAFHDGTLFRQTQAGFGTAPGQSQSGATNMNIEYILKPNTEYGIVRTTYAASVDAFTIADLYEGLE